MRSKEATRGASLYGTKRGRKQPSVKRTYYLKTHEEASRKYNTLKAQGHKVAIRLKTQGYRTYRVQVFR